MALVKRKRLNTSLEKELYDKLWDLSTETRVPVSKYIDEAIKDLLKKYQNRQHST